MTRATTRCTFLQLSGLVTNGHGEVLVVRVAHRGWELPGRQVERGEGAARRPPAQGRGGVRLRCRAGTTSVHRSSASAARDARPHVRLSPRERDASRRGRAPSPTARGSLLPVPSTSSPLAGSGTAARRARPCRRDSLPHVPGAALREHRRRAPRVDGRLSLTRGADSSAAIRVELDRELELA